MTLGACSTLALAGEQVSAKLEMDLSCYLAGVVELEGVRAAFVVNRDSGAVQQLVLGQKHEGLMNLLRIHEDAATQSLAVEVEFLGALYRIAPDGGSFMLGGLPQSTTAAPKPQIQAPQTPVKLAEDTWPLPAPKVR